MLYKLNFEKHFIELEYNKNHYKTRICIIDKNIINNTSLEYVDSLYLTELVNTLNILNHIQSLKEKQFQKNNIINKNGNKQL